MNRETDSLGDLWELPSWWKVALAMSPAANAAAALLARGC